MGKLISFMHVSLDGFVSGPNGEMDWIYVDEEIFNYGADRINKTDFALYGKNTYQMMEAYWPTAANQPNASKHDIEHSLWYKDVKKIVLSSTLTTSNNSNTIFIDDNLKEEIIKLKQGTEKEILIFGSPTATHSLIEADLVDGYWLYVNPILLGNGIPLFKNITHKKSLTLVKSHSFASGVICLSYVLNQNH